MNNKATTGRRSDTEHSAYNGTDQHDHGPPGMDLPGLGHVPYKSIGFLAALGVAGAAGAIEWPVAAAVGVGYMLARR